MFEFGKKMEVQVRDSSGAVKTVKVSQKEFDSWVSEGRIQRTQSVDIEMIADAFLLTDFELRDQVRKLNEKHLPSCQPTDDFAITMVGFVLHTIKSSFVCSALGKLPNANEVWNTAMASYFKQRDSHATPSAPEVLREWVSSALSLLELVEQVARSLLKESPTQDFAARLFGQVVYKRSFPGATYSTQYQLDFLEGFSQILAQSINSLNATIEE